MATKKATVKVAATPPVFTYRPAIVTFMDILGFKAMIGKKSAQQVGDLLGRFGKIADGDVRDSDNWPSGLARAIAFSDSIVRVCPIDGNRKSGSFFHELLSLVHIQAELAVMGVFLRGGMTVGDIHFSGTTIYGPALVRAYEMESQFASYPRIVIDPSVIETYVTNPAMRGGMHTIEEDREYTNELMRLSDDGLYFVDYLQAIRTEFDDISHYKVIMRRHRDMIVEGSTGWKGFSNVKQKFSWLAHYHNSVAERAFDDASGLDDLLVDLSELLYPSLKSEMEAAAKG